MEEKTACSARSVSTRSPERALTFAVCSGRDAACSLLSASVISASSWSLCSIWLCWTASFSSAAAMSRAVALDQAAEFLDRARR